MVYELVDLMLAFITLLLGGALIIFIYDAYRLSRDPTLLHFTLGLFILVIGLVVPDVLTLSPAPAAGLGAVVSRILEIIGMGVMIVSVLRG